jgi:hypothetical protein
MTDILICFVIIILSAIYISLQDINNNILEIKDILKDKLK